MHALAMAHKHHHLELALVLVILLDQAHKGSCLAVNLNL